MSLQSQLNSFVVRVAERLAEVDDRAGALDQLKTQARSNLVAAINELADRGAPQGGGAFEFVQVTPLRIWTINHNLGLRPSVSIVDTGGQEVEADIHHASPNQLSIHFAIPIAGVARLT